MCREKLEVRNFGPIPSADISFFPLTIFIGNQGSGKSTISKLLTICRDMRWHYAILEKDEKNIMRPFREFSIDEYFCAQTYLRYQNDADESIIYENGVFSFKLGKNNDVEREKRTLKKLMTQTTETLIKKTGINIDKKIDSHTLNLLRANTRVGLYIPAERNSLGLLSESIASLFINQIPLSNVILEYMSIYEKAKKEFPTYEVPFLNAKYVKRDGRDRISLMNGEKDLSINACSSGLQSTLPMLMVIDYSRNADCFDSFVVEEPEQNLFPRNQRALMYFLISRLNNNQCSFVLTTHSPYLLSCLNVQMLAYKLSSNTDLQPEVETIVPKDCMIDPNLVRVYSLASTGEEKEYCRSLMSEKTGMISINELDSVSDSIGEDFDRLYSIYLQTKKK